jgi:hypothetical protein
VPTTQRRNGKRKQAKIVDPNEERIGPEDRQVAAQVAKAIKADPAGWHIAGQLLDLLEPDPAKRLYRGGAVGDGDPNPHSDLTPKQFFESQALELPMMLTWPLAGGPPMRPYPKMFGRGDPRARDAEVLVTVWQLLCSGAYRLLRRCHYCGTWTLNAGRNRRKRFCSPNCKVLWWNHASAEQKRRQRAGR